jgi:hypothetical protein
MSDHAIMLIVSVVGFSLQIAGLIWAHRHSVNMLRESQRLTRAALLGRE